ncbi:glycosyltransferase [Paenibacillus sp. FSL H8-0261]|uniref:glycosyltransferase n=1 Tax=Paenibacillus sp. FSL H8-0261 TaxID=2921381 RepID=UPI00324D4DB3
MIKYSVLSSVYEKEKPEYLKESIKSIFNQTVPTDDFILVKDGPLNEELEEVIRDFMYQYPNNMSVLEIKKNVGLAAALNIGLKACKYDLVARMDTDDISTHNRFELQLAEFEKNSSLDLVGTYMDEFIDNPNEINAVKKVPLDQISIFKYGKRRNPFNHPTVMYKKNTVISLGGYNSVNRGEDIDLFIRMILNGSGCKNIGLSLVKYRTNDDMLARRKSWSTTKAYVGVIYRSWRKGYSSLVDLTIVAAAQIIISILPLKIERWVFRKLFRKSPPLVKGNR